MGPTFGIKGGAAGGGYSQVVPFESLNLHLTGDVHAVTAANNLLAAMVDNHIYHGNTHGLDPHDVTWKRVLDVNDRSSGTSSAGSGRSRTARRGRPGSTSRPPRRSWPSSPCPHRCATCASAMGRIVVGYTSAGEPVTAEQIKAAGAMTVIMRDAIKPNLLQTLENTPALVHAGPFGNIAHGNSSVVADLIGIHAGEFLVTEAGFGADMGAERFFNIKCRTSGLVPDAAVVVTTVRAMKLHSGATVWWRVAAATGHAGGEPRRGPARRGQPPGPPGHRAPPRRHARRRHQRHGGRLPLRARRHPGDRGVGGRTVRRVHALRERRQGCRRTGRGGRGSDGGAGRFHMLYDDEASLRQKIETVATEIYGADGVDYRPRRRRQLDMYERAGFGSFPGLHRQDPPLHLVGSLAAGCAPGWRLPVREARANVGAGFVYLISGDMRTMPGLSSSPAAERIDIDENGNVVGLY